MPVRGLPPSNRPPCPACHRPFPPPLLVTGTLRQRLVNIVADRLDGIEIHDLVDLIYADSPSGGPLTAAQSVSVMMRKANRQLLSQGFQIKAMRLGRGARYCLVKVVP